ncbi:MAG: ankyrin repeat domain-containing protein [Oligoflexia bacterium]|nr:ankyrin repeat domain-containing protein [Oligoflexia bacterium]
MTNHYLPVFLLLLLLLVSCHDKIENSSSPSKAPEDQGSTNEAINDPILNNPTSPTPAISPITTPNNTSNNASVDADTALLKAITSNDLEKIRELITKKTLSANPRDEQGRTPLMLAITSSSEETIKLLLDQYPYDILETDKEDRSLFDYLKDYKEASKEAFQEDLRKKIIPVVKEEIISHKESKEISPEFKKIGTIFKNHDLLLENKKNLLQETLTKEAYQLASYLINDAQYYPKSSDTKGDNVLMTVVKIDDFKLMGSYLLQLLPHYQEPKEYLNNVNVKGKNILKVFFENIENRLFAPADDNDVSPKNIVDLLLKYGAPDVSASSEYPIYYRAAYFDEPTMNNFYHGNVTCSGKSEGHSAWIELNPKKGTFSVDIVHFKDSKYLIDLSVMDGKLLKNVQNFQLHKVPNGNRKWEFSFATEEKFINSIDNKKGIISFQVKYRKGAFLDTDPGVLVGVIIGQRATAELTYLGEQFTDLKCDPTQDE